MKQQPGKDMHVVGGATLVSSLMNAGLIDELQLMVNPLILGGGKALFKDVKERHVLKLVRTKPLKSGKVSLTYSTTVNDGGDRASDNHSGDPHVAALFVTLGVPSSLVMNRATRPPIRKPAEQWRRSTATQP